MYRSLINELDNKNNKIEEEQKYQELKLYFKSKKYEKVAIFRSKEKIFHESFWQRKFVKKTDNHKQIFYKCSYVKCEMAAYLLFTKNKSEVAFYVEKGSHAMYHHLKRGGLSNNFFKILANKSYSTIYKGSELNMNEHSDTEFKPKMTNVLTEFNQKFQDASNLSCNQTYRNE